ncbi:MAG: MarR family transcriptional regulator [Rhizomicrobium sp.]
MSDDVRDLHTALLNLVGILNEPQRDEALIKAAGIALDRALFPLLVRIERNGPIGVVRLAELAGRDHTTVSRQVARLEELGLVARHGGADDKRRREVSVTKKGLAMTKALDRAREKMIGPKLARWSEADRRQLIRLLQKLVRDAGD